MLLRRPPGLRLQPDSLMWREAAKEGIAAAAEMVRLLMLKQP